MYWRIYSVRRGVAYNESLPGLLWWVKAVAWNVLVWGPVSLLLILLSVRF
jgi:hypothetical protein